MAVHIDGDKCIGCGLCVQICPDVFSMDEGKGIAKVLRPEAVGCIEDAIASCPVSCITQEE